MKTPSKIFEVPSGPDILKLRMKELEARIKKESARTFADYEVQIEKAKIRNKKIQEQIKLSGANLPDFEAIDGSFSKQRQEELKTIQEQLRHNKPESGYVPDYVKVRLHKARQMEAIPFTTPVVSAHWHSQSIPGADDLSGVDVDIIASNPEAQQVGAGLIGSGSGWQHYGGPSPQYHASVAWCFFYAPAQTRIYHLTPHVFFRGTFIVRAFDEWWNSKYASVYAGLVQAHVWQSDDMPFNYTGSNLFGYGDDNIDMNGRFDADVAETFDLPMEANKFAIITVYASFGLIVRGEDSYAEMNFGGSPYNYIACPFMNIT